MVVAEKVEVIVSVTGGIVDGISLEGSSVVMDGGVNGNVESDTSGNVSIGVRVVVKGGAVKEVDGIFADVVVVSLVKLSDSVVVRTGGGTSKVEIGTDSVVGIVDKLSVIVKGSEVVVTTKVSVTEPEVVVKSGFVNGSVDMEVCSTGKICDVVVRSENSVVVRIGGGIVKMENDSAVVVKTCSVDDMEDEVVEIIKVDCVVVNSGGLNDVSGKVEVSL